MCFDLHLERFAFDFVLLRVQTMVFNYHLLQLQSVHLGDATTATTIIRLFELTISGTS